MSNEAKARYTELHSTFDRMIKRVSEDNPRIDPDSADWGDVADLSYVVECIKEVHDRMFKEGEYS